MGLSPHVNIVVRQEGMNPALPTPPLMFSSSPVHPPLLTCPSWQIRPMAAEEERGQNVTGACPCSQGWVSYVHPGRK